MKNINLREYRCGCGKLLFKGSLLKGTVEVKCRHCREIASFLGRMVVTNTEERATS